MTISLSDGSLEVIENVTRAGKPMTECGRLLDSARQAFQLLEPWCQASSSSQNYIVMDVIAQVKEQAVNYFEAIDMSIDVTQDGVTFAEEGINFCDLLCQEITLDDLISYLDGMQELASDAHQRAEAMLSKFRSIRTGLFQVTGNISAAVEHAARGAHYAQASKRRYQRVAAVANSVTTLSAANGVLIGIIGAFCVAIPHLGLILPAVLPLVAFGAQKVEDRCAYKIELRSTQETSCKEALVELGRVNTELDKVLIHVGAFSEWWSNMETLIVGIKGSVSRLNSSSLDAARISIVKQRWESIKWQYQSYDLEISKLKDFYPTLSFSGPSGAKALLMTSPGKQLTIDQVPIDLVFTMTHIADLVSKCQTAFRSLGVASVNLTKENAITLHRKLYEVGESLKREWEGLHQYLKLVIAFSEDIAHASAADTGSANTETHDDVFWVMVMGLVKAAQSVVDSNKATRDAFSSNRDAMAKILHSSGPRSKTTRSSTLGAMKSKDAVHQFDPQHSSQHKLSHPDHSQSLPIMGDTLNDIGSAAEDLVKFWHSRSAVMNTLCRTSASKDENDHPGHINRKTMLASITSIEKSIDALVLEALGPGHSSPSSMLKNPQDRSRFRQLFSSRSQTLA